MEENRLIQFTWGNHPVDIHFEENDNGVIVTTIEQVPYEQSQYLILHYIQHILV